MHLLSNNFCELLEKVKKEGKAKHFGQFLRYNKIYFAKLSSGDECITMEEFVTGDITKCINNTGKMFIGLN